MTLTADGRITFDVLFGLPPSPPSPTPPSNPLMNVFQLRAHVIVISPLVLPPLKGESCQPGDASKVYAMVFVHN